MEFHPQGTYYKRLHSLACLVNIYWVEAGRTNSMTYNVVEATGRVKIFVPFDGMSEKTFIVMEIDEKAPPSMAELLRLNDVPTSVEFEW